MNHKSILDAWQTGQRAATSTEESLLISLPEALDHAVENGYSSKSQEAIAFIFGYYDGINAQLNRIAETKFFKE